MIVKIFVKSGCPKCPAAKKLGEKLKDKVEVEIHSLDEPEGLAEATYYGVLSTPSVIVTESDEEIASWRGCVPDLEEVEKVIS